MRVIAGYIDLSDQLAQEGKRHHEQRDADEREMYDELAASYLRTHKGLDTQTHKAKIETHNGWWFRYAVHRTVGIGIPENSCSLHRTLKGAERAVRRWKAREYTPTIVEQS
jgi:hypothetical protein